MIERDPVETLARGSEAAAEDIILSVFRDGGDFAARAGRGIGPGNVLATGRLQIRGGDRIPNGGLVRGGLRGGFGERIGLWPGGRWGGGGNRACHQRSVHLRLGKNVA